MSDAEVDAIALDDVPDGGMRAVAVGETKMLLLRDGEVVSAVGAQCPHAGAPLEQGVRNGRRLVCPWHKATFCIDTGRLLEPPALDDLPSYPVRVSHGRVYVTPVAVARPTAVDCAKDRTFVVVGAGAAGAVAVQTLREAGFAGRLILLDAVNRVPYDRTLLSKYHLSGEEGAEKTPLQSQSFYREHAIERRTATVTRLDAPTRRIECSDGEVLTYDKALIATGVMPVAADVAGADLANVFTLRSRADADAILAQAERSQRAVVLGASFIGLEVAASLRERGLDVTIVGREPVPLAKQLGETVGRVFVDLHERRGVRFRLRQDVAMLEATHAVTAVVLKTGERLPADMVVAGLGVTSVTSYVRGVALADDGGVPVDAMLCAADDLYAAGDIARFPANGHGAPMRVEHWRVAQQQGRVAALNMLGRMIRFSAPPVFWTIQYRKRLDYIGHADTWDEIVIHGDLGKPEFLAYYVKDGVVAAAVGMDRDRDTAALGELFAMRAWSAAELGRDPHRVLERSSIGR